MTSPQPTPAPVTTPATTTPTTPTTPITSTPTTTVTTRTSTSSRSVTTPPPDPNRPSNTADAAWFDAIAAEHGAIYGYGIVSAHSTPDDNQLVSESMAQHRARREAAIALLDARSVATPLPAAGYQLPLEVSDPTQAAQLAVRMEEDAAVAWRAVLEQATTTDDRRVAVTALTESAVLAARWTQVLGGQPVTLAFPGGSE